MSRKSRKILHNIKWVRHFLCATISAFKIVFTPCSCVSVANSEQVIVCWERSYQRHSLLNQDLILHLILQLLKLLKVSIRLAEDGKEWTAYNFNYPPSMVSIEIFFIKFACSYFIVYKFSFSLLRKSISVKEDNKTSWVVLSRGQIETTSVFFCIRDEWSREY